MGSGSWVAFRSNGFSCNMVTTQFELDGYRVARTLGVVRGIVVRSRSIFERLARVCKHWWGQHYPVDKPVREKHGQKRST